METNCDNAERGRRRCDNAGVILRSLSLLVMRGLIVFGVKSLLSICKIGVHGVTRKEYLCSRSMDSSQNFLQFLKLVGNLKHLPRAGWVMRGVKEPETVASHMYRMAMMTYALHPRETNLDMDKVIKMALVHDLAESLVGDITPLDGVSRKRKRKMETEAMYKIAKLLGQNGRSVMILFNEYEDQRTPESRFVKQLDCLDMRLQAFEYEKKEGAPGKYQEFIDSTEGKFTHPDIIKLVREIDRERALFAEANGVIEDEDADKSDDDEFIVFDEVQSEEEHVDVPKKMKDVEIITKPTDQSSIKPEEHNSSKLQSPRKGDA